MPIYHTMGYTNETVMDVGYNTVTESGFVVVISNLASQLTQNRYIKVYKKKSTDADSEYAQIYFKQIYANTAADTSYTVTLTDQKPNTTYNIKVELSEDDGSTNQSVVNVTTSMTAGNLSVSTVGDTFLTLNLTGLSKAIGKKVKFYYRKFTDADYTQAGDMQSLYSTETETSQVLIGLTADTLYRFKADIYDPTDETKLLGTYSAGAATQAQIAAMTLEQATNASLRVKLSQFNTQNAADGYYRYQILWYIKRKTDASYQYAATDTQIISQASEVSHTFEGLLPETVYAVRTVISDSTSGIIKAILETEYTTLVATERIPTPTITAWKQTVRTKDISLYWEAPDHKQEAINYAGYKIEISTDGSTFTELTSAGYPPALRNAACDTVNLPLFDTIYYIRVKSCILKDTSQVKYSNTVQIKAESKFSWGLNTESTTYRIMAEKWNLALEYFISVLKARGFNGNYIYPNKVEPGNSVSAENYNKFVTIFNLISRPAVMTVKVKGNPVVKQELVNFENFINE